MNNVQFVVDELGKLCAGTLKETAWNTVAEVMREHNIEPSDERTRYVQQAISKELYDRSENLADKIIDTVKDVCEFLSVHKDDAAGGEKKFYALRDEMVEIATAIGHVVAMDCLEKWKGLPSAPDLRPAIN